LRDPSSWRESHSTTGPNSSSTLRSQLLPRPLHTKASRQSIAEAHATPGEIAAREQDDGGVKSLRALLLGVEPFELVEHELRVAGAELAPHACLDASRHHGQRATECKCPS